MLKSMDENPSMLSWPMRSYQFTLPLRYHLTDPSELGLVICLHGYQDHALSMIRRMGWCQTPVPFQILAINGPYPVPLRTESGYREAYSWYFRDSNAKVMLVDPVSTSKVLGKFIDDLSLTNVRKVIVGFSQGGFLAPYLAPYLKELRGIVGIGCGYNIEAYSKISPVPVNAIHGDVDERVKLAQSKTDYAQLSQYGHSGKFHQIPGLVHRVESSVEPLVRKLALDCLAADPIGRTK